MFDQDTLILISPPSPRPIEFFVTSHWLTEQAINRKREIHSEHLGRDLCLPTPEDFILLKSAYWQHPSRQRAKAAQDGVDIESVAQATVPHLDMSYIEENARELGTWAALAELLELGETG